MGDAFLFLVGAVAGFALVGLVAQAGHDAPFAPQAGDRLRTGLFQVVAAGVAFGAAALVGTMRSFLVWPAGAFAATLIYLTVAAIEFVLADAAHRQ